MKPVTVVKAKIHCSKCGYKAVANVQDWLHKPCPNCGAPDIVSDEDMALHTLITKLASAINEIVGDVPEGPVTKIHIDTAQQDKQP